LSPIERILTKRVVVTRGAAEDPRCRDRLQALLARLDGPPPELVPDARLPQILEALGHRQDLPRGGLARRGREKELVALARLDSDEVFPGYSWRERRDGRHEARDHGVLCQTALEIQSVVGCPFDCTYCPYGPFVCARIDVESFVDRVTALARARRSQAIYKLNNRSDSLGLEPEYGLTRALVTRFANLPDKYLMLYSKGNEVEHLLDLDHGGKTIGCFTLTPAAVARVIEPGAPAPAARLEAMARLARAGYPLRVRLSPIVPVVGWQEAYAELLTQLARAARPELVTLWALSMIELDLLAEIVPLDLLDPEAMAAARAAAPELAGRKSAPFPLEIRVAMYRAIAAMIRETLPEARVSLCLETPEVWQRMSSLVVPRRGPAFVCNCGPRATPAAVAAATTLPTPPAGRRSPRGPRRR
jgi:spore photoproduct lyase